MHFKLCVFATLYMQLRDDRYETIKYKFTLASHWTDVANRMKPEDDEDFEVTQFGNMCYFLATERLSQAMSLMYALQMLPGRRLGHGNRPLEDLTSLNVHVVILDSQPWEIFMHRLPNLCELNVVFVMQGKDTNKFHDHNRGVTLHRCNDCEVRNRVITYSVQQMMYHLYYSSTEYTEPDVVVVFGNSCEMTTSKENNIHSEISYRNMTYSKDTVLVLTDVTKELVIQGVKSVNAVRSVDQIVPSQINPFSGHSSNRAEMGADIPVINDRYYFTCLKRM